MFIDKINETYRIEPIDNDELFEDPVLVMKLKST